MGTPRTRVMVSPVPSWTPIRWDRLTHSRGIVRSHCHHESVNIWESTVSTIVATVIGGGLLTLLTVGVVQLRKRVTTRRPTLELVRSPDGTYWHFRLARNRPVYDIRAREDQVHVPSDGAIHDFTGGIGFTMDQPRISDDWTEAHIHWVDKRRYGVVLRRGEPSQHVYPVFPAPDPTLRGLRRLRN